MEATGLLAMVANDNHGDPAFIASGLAPTLDSVRCNLQA